MQSAAAVALRDQGPSNACGPLERLARLGASGTRPEHIERDLLRACAAESGIPFLCAEATTFFKDPTTGLAVEKKHQVLLAYEILDQMFHHDSAKFAVSFGIGAVRTVTRSLGSPGKV